MSATIAHVLPRDGDFSDDSEQTAATEEKISNSNEVAKSDEVVNVEAVARLMKVGRNTVYALVARNQIPHRRLGKQIRFHRVAVMRWLASWSLQGAQERH